MFTSYLDQSMMLKAKKRKILDVSFVNPRDHGVGVHKSVDDIPYGGGPGMVLRPEPMVAAIEEAKRLAGKDSKVIALTPGGALYDQSAAQTLSKLSSVILVCGRYEGFDERIMSYVDEQISIGNYVLTGGELPALSIIDSVTRLIPGVLGDERSAVDESFSEGVNIEFPQYTRPNDFRGEVVPEVLRSGNHAKINSWREAQSSKRTTKRSQ